jgi:hypothetical protein
VGHDSAAGDMFRHSQMVLGLIATMLLLLFGEYQLGETGTYLYAHSWTFLRARPGILPYGRPLFRSVRSRRARLVVAAQPQDGTAGLVRAPDGPHQPPSPCLEEPSGAGRLYSGRIPSAWDAFWLFWCDQVQPPVRRATGRDDVWAIGLSMSKRVGDTGNQFQQFLLAYDADT